MAGIPIVQLSNTNELTVIVTAYDSPIWKTRLWVDPYEKHLPFMVEEDTKYNHYEIIIGNIFIDFVEYLRVNSYEELRKTDLAWWSDPNEPSVVYMHFKNSNPPSSFVSFKTGILWAFSYGKSVLLGRHKTYPLLLDFPEIEDSSDNFEYKRMAFSTGNVVIDNSTGLLDEFTGLFGNDINFLNLTENGSLEFIRQFYVENYTIGLDSIKLSVKDKRSRLTLQAPNTFYTLEKYPHIEDNLENKVIQDAYGYCRGVEGTCLNRKEIYAKFPLFEGEELVEEGEFNDWFQFKFARRITKIEKVFAKMSDVWTEVFPGLGVEGNEPAPLSDDPDEPEVIYWQDINPHPIKIIHKNEFGIEIKSTIPDNGILTGNMLNNDGRIEIWWSQAMRDNRGHLHRRNGDANTVKMTGIFVDLHTPGDIVKDMMTYYGHLPYESSYFDLSDWEREMEGGRPIGICLDSAKNIYDWIEQIQNGSFLGFQLLINKNLFTARVDNSTRDESFNIHWAEILNRNEVELELNGEKYATFTTINYLQDYTDKEWKTEIDQSKQTAIMDVYKYEKEFVNNAFLSGTGDIDLARRDVLRKSKAILDNYMEVRPIYRGIQLDGLRLNEIKLFSTGWIDFTVEIPRQMKIVQKYMKPRLHHGKMRVKVLSYKRNWKDSKITIDVIADEEIIFDIDGMNPEFKDFDYQVDYDQMYAETLDSEYEVIIDEGVI